METSYMERSNVGAELIKGIVAYVAEDLAESGIIVRRLTAGHNDYCLTKEWDTLTEFLTEDKGEALHIVWNLAHFTKIIFSLLPDTDWVGKETKIVFGATKLFYVERMLGIGFKKYIRGNICKAYENNFYQLQHWMPEQDEPKGALELCQRGEKVLEALEYLNIYPNKLTSPVGLFAQSLPQMPTLLTGPDTLVDVANYCAPMMRKEWRQIFQEGYYEKLHSYDVVSAYPYFIMNLPNTDNCTVEHVTTCRPLARNQWGIFKGEYKRMGDIQPIRNEEYLTSDQLRYLEYWQSGDFKLEDGYILTFKGDDKPYWEVINSLYNQRISLKDYEIATFLAKNIAQGISGKLDEIRDEEKLGDFCNPIYAAMVRSKTSLRIGHNINQWIKNGQISANDLVHVNLDEVTFRNPVKDFCQKQDLRPGDWRYRIKENVVVA